MQQNAHHCHGFGLGVSGFKGRQHPAVCRAVGGRGPLRKFFLECLFACYGLQPRKAFVFANPFLPTVGNAGRFGRILNTNKRVGVHGRLNHVQTLGARGNAQRVFQVGHPLHRIRREIFLCAPGIAEHKRKIARIKASQTNGKVAARLIGTVLRTICRGLVCTVGIDAKHRKVARVSRPHPVVGVAAKLADVGGRCAHKPHVFKHLVHEHIILVAVVKWQHLYLIVRAGFGVFFKPFAARANAVGAFFLAHLAREAA